MTITDFDLVFMRVADAFADLAKCTHRNVGAVVVSDDGRIWGHGYNRPPDDQKSCLKGDCMRGLLAPGQGAPDYSDCITVHAEIGAMMMAGSTLCEASTLYVNSMPCPMCLRVAEGNLVRRVVWSVPDRTGLFEKQF